jgi:mono/diheme cytochrome c family protein
MKTAILSMLCLLFNASSSYAHPAISFSQLNYDFAMIGQEEQVEHVFEFTNTGDQKLVIYKLQANPVTKLTLTMDIKYQVHLNQYKATEIFSEKCRDCHVDQGKGKTGWDLFKQDCFMCHNAGKNTSLSGMSKKTKAYLLRVIKQGVDNTIMPGWATEAGGPLDDAEIKSLVDMIKH